MRVELDLPEWCDERNVYIMAGIELAAYKDHNSDVWYVKVERCNQCGRCCQNLGGSQVPLTAEKVCVHLTRDGEKLICGLGAMRPLPCGEGDPVKNGEPQAEEYCSIRYKAAK